jgi:hypothetical protein
MNLRNAMNTGACLIIAAVLALAGGRLLAAPADAGSLGGAAKES